MYVCVCVNMRDARGCGGDRIGSGGRTGVDACGSAPMDATREMDGTGRDGTGRDGRAQS